MVRSMFSGVAGMKAHQTRMDVIGNNIANVNTYGFKSSRATFRDVYYQTTRGAAAGDGNRGGLNPSQVGYGSSVGSIDVLQTQSTMSTTGNPLDLAITGEGFLQVQDADGNIFYTKAGMLDIDSAGNLVDVNGNFVLGTSGSPVGKAPGSDKIKFTIPPVNPASSSVTDSINNIAYTITSSNNTDEGNIQLNISSSSELPIGQKVEAKVTSNGINIILNDKETFADINELNDEINKAITAANGGAQHPGGTFTISSNAATPFQDLTGKEIAGQNFGITPGTVPLNATVTGAGFSIATVGDKFSVTAGQPNFKITQKTAGNAAIVPPTENEYTFEIEIGGKTYTGELTASQMQNPGKLVLKNAGGDSADCITINYPAEGSMIAKLATDNDGDGNPDKGGDGKYTFAGWAGPTDATSSTPAKDLGLGGGKFMLQGGTKGGPQSVKDLSGIAIGSDGVIIANHPIHGEIEVGRIDLATFDNPAGLAQSGNTYFTQTANSGDPSLKKPGTGGTGMLAQSALEMSNVDLSQEFADMITTQRGFQANSRLITVSDTMLEELINLKR